MEWIVVVTVLIMTVLSLMRINVVLAIVVASLVAGLMSGMNITDTISMFIDGMSGQMETALSYILLGAFAVAIGYTGITTLLVNVLVKVLTGKKTMMVLALAGVACLSQNLIPVHIAFIPILIPPLLKLFDQMRLDRRAVACALTFGLQAPYIMLPVGFGLVFQKIVLEGLNSNGLSLALGDVSKAMLIPGAGMIVGLLIAVFITYRKDRDLSGLKVELKKAEEQIAASTKAGFTRQHLFTIIAIIAALGIQIWTKSLVAGALAGILCMFVFVAVPFRKNDKIVSEGIGMMGLIAFVMLAASGYGTILKDTGAVDALVKVSANMPGIDNKVFMAFILLLIGLLITIGIGSSFGTIPIIAALYVPMCIAAGFSPFATAILIGTAGALGDAGSPASDSTLGPTAGLNADGRHNHIWDTCVPTFLHYNIPLLVFGWVGAIMF
ncbi:Na+/H+ antiporter NhaC family protein [Aciduricibacillus chroicocephali]|uniref:Na+/H+ antiporter NhaC family protein n=1 Tax=Aciduricibacillus chroicocephali TaxID=3054939 RepID=A0ABY9KXA7_9BACI|nr:Na+/H+ antiporter NhaC family protein [Bacillaceae bacterium 44XB]